MFIRQQQIAEKWRVQWTGRVFETTAIGVSEWLNDHNFNLSHNFSKKYQKRKIRVDII
jgi:hypothetical protein